LPGAVAAGIELDRLVIVLDGAFVILIEIIGGPAIPERQAQFRIEPQRFVVVLDRAIVLALVDEHVAAVVEGLRVRGIEPHRLACVGERAVELADRAVSVGALAKGSGVVRIERNGAIEIREGLLHLVGVPCGLAPIDERIRDLLGRVARGIDQGVTGRYALLWREGAVVVCGADCGVGVALGASRRCGEGGEQAKDDAGRHGVDHS
jgi:hypothetical protein